MHGTWQHGSCHAWLCISYLLGRLDAHWHFLANLDSIGTLIEAPSTKTWVYSRPSLLLITWSPIAQPQHPLSITALQQYQQITGAAG